MRFLFLGLLLRSFHCICFLVFVYLTLFIYPNTPSALCLIKNFTRNIEVISRRFLEKLILNPFYETTFHYQFHIYPVLQFWKKINIKAAMYSNNKKGWFFVKGTLYVASTPPKKTYNQDTLSLSHQRDILNI